MALFLRGNMWWMEYRTRKVRKVLSTGCRKPDKAKAKQVFEAFKLAMRVKPERSATKKILDSIYGRAEGGGVPLDLAWGEYVRWRDGKGRKNAESSEYDKRREMAKLVAWAKSRHLGNIEDIGVELAREYVKLLTGANKTIRNKLQQLGTMWRALAALHPGIHNPWPAVTPDDDGSSVRREAFTREEEERVFQACKEAGNDWFLASLISRWTGLRYGDVSRLVWGQVDLKEGSLSVTPSKTAKHGIKLCLPLAKPLKAALEERAKQLKGKMDPEDYILPSHASAVSYGGMKFGHNFTPILAAAGIDTSNHTFHSWRHTFRTRLAEAGVSDDMARRLGGWTNLEMAGHYDHAKRLTEMREAIEKSR